MANDVKNSPAARPPKPPSMSTWSKLTQMYPPKPQFTEKDVHDLTGKVYMVTGSNTGVGKEVASILYSKNAKVYMVARSEHKANSAMEDIKAAHSQSTGVLEFLYLDFADLTTIKPAVDKFLAKESRLHVLFNNAAVQALKDDGSIRTAQGHEIHLGVNVLGPFLLTHLLTPTIVQTAAVSPHNSVRVVWVCSLGAEICGEASKGLSDAYLTYWPSLSPLERYGVIKAGNWLHGVEFARRLRDAGVVSVPCNPGHLQSELYRDASFAFRTLLGALALYPPVYGAYTELFAALSPAVTLAETGQWVVPWGRFYPMREDLLDATKSPAEGGNGHAEKFWLWTEELVKEFL